MSLSVSSYSICKLDTDLIKGLKNYMLFREKDGGKSELSLFVLVLHSCNIIRLYVFILMQNCSSDKLEISIFLA